MTERAIGGAKEVLTKRPLESGGLLKMFVVKTVGFPSPADLKFTDGLEAAAEEFPPLKRFIVLFQSWPSREFNQALCDTLPSFKLLNNGRTGIPNSDPAKPQIEKEIEEILTPQGIKALQAAADEANKIWGDPTLCPE